jgi:hypothetical protein
MGAILNLLAWCFPDLLLHWSLEKKWAKSSAKDSRIDPINKKSGSDDPVYRRNLQRLIDRNRQFEEARK